MANLLSADHITNEKIASMKRIIPLLALVLFYAILSGQHTNVMISSTGYPEEPTICINPKNTQEIFAGSNLNHVFFSADGGLTWVQEQLTSTYGVWGDPCIIVDTAGTFYYFHLSNPPQGNWIDRIVCQRYDTVVSAWTPGTYMGLNGTKAQDKEWAVVDPRNNNIYVTWTQFDDYGSSDPNDSSMIMFSRSFNRGDTWSPALRINKVAGDCIDSDNTVEGAVPTVGPNGQIYVSWSGPLGIMFDRSLDEGVTWLEEDIFVSDQPGGWDYSIPGIMRCNGLPITCCDISNGPYRGNIYVNWTDQRNGPTDTDVWFVKSSNGGDTWSLPLRVNDDPPGKHQFFTWMTIDQVTGWIYIVYYDRRNYNDNQTDVWMAVSKDGGDSFFNFRISESPFVPVSSVFFGDYNNISAHNNVVRPIWTRLHNSQLSIWTAIIDMNWLGAATPEPAPFNIEPVYPNPFEQSTYFKFKLHDPSVVSLQVLDLNGSVISTIYHNQLLPVGKYLEQFHPEKYRLASGVYLFRFECDGRVVTRKIVYQK
jgi:hypothetical protein